jgi:uncharacterized protein YcbK (DUF882 family)
LWPVGLLLWALLLPMAKKNNIELFGPLLIVLIGAAAYFKFRKKMDNGNQNKSLDNLEQNLSKDFKLKEFKSNDGAPFTPEVYQNLTLLAKNLQVLREYVQKPITITSGYRSPAYNNALAKKGTGAVKNSFHTKGMAADMQIKGMSPSQVANTIEKLINAGKMQQGGLGRYPNFTHYDIRGTKQRW